MKGMISFQRIVLFTIAMFLFCSSSVRAQGIFYGDSVALGNGLARTWVEIDAASIPVRVGTTITEGLLSNLPSSEREFSLNLPAVASDSLFTHVLFDWNPNGHPPFNIWGLPHFDIHFYIVSRQEREAVVGGPDTPVPPQFLPPDYVADSNPPIAVPNMGSHWTDTTSPEWQGQQFTRTLIYGFYRAETYFVEPMITRAHFQTNPDDTLIIKQPAVYQKTGYYPTKYRIYYDAANQEYDVVMEDFVLRTATAIADKNGRIPEAFSLSQNFPNPFNPSTTIDYQLPQRSDVTIRIFDVLGREIATLVDEIKSAGSYTVRWNASGHGSGVYYYRLKAKGFVETRKLVLLK